MDPAVFLVALVTVVGTAAVTIVKVARLWTGRPESPSADVTARLEALERSVRDLQQEQADTQERLDFAERRLSKARAAALPLETAPPTFGVNAPGRKRKSNRA